LYTTERARFTAPLYIYSNTTNTTNTTTMIWGQQKQENGDASSQKPEKSRAETNEPTPVKPAPLTPELQRLVDDEDDFLDQLYDG
jgi:hypothetical protein